jgi:nucleotide-binding universal stress UspA family protein
MIELKQILVATDFSPTSEVALKYGKALAERFRASLHLLHVIEDPFVHGWTAEGYIPDLASFREGLARRAREQMEKVLDPAEFDKLHARLSVKFGNPFIEIVRLAKQDHTDLIVLGTHGRGPIAHLLMGSVAEKVVRKAPCPVLTVRHPEHEFVMP